MWLFVCLSVIPDGVAYLFNNIVAGIVSHQEVGGLVMMVIVLILVLIRNRYLVLVRNS